MATKKTALEATAYHEASHAVFAIDLRIPFKYATIVESEDSFGHVLLDRWKHFEPDLNSDAKTFARIESLVVCFLAGGIGEAHVTGRKSKLTGHDDHDAANIASYRYPDPKIWEKYLAYLRAVTEARVDHPYIWESIQKAAKVLLERKTIKAASVRQAMREVTQGGRQFTGLL